MKIVHLTTSVSKNSACARINDALLSQGIDSKIVVLKLNNDYPFEFEIKSKYKKKLNSLISYIERKYINSRKSNVKPVFSVSLNSIGCEKYELVLEADIIHIHWCNWGLLNIKDLYKLTKMGKKIVWTMHDSWGFTGGCHVRYECTKYINGCNRCPMIGSHLKKDLSYYLWNMKKKYYDKSKFTVVVPSLIHRSFAEKSKLLNSKKICVINNPIDNKKYKRIDKCIARDILNLPMEKTIILFGAIDAKNKYKGSEYLIEALKKYKENNDISNIHIAIFGSNEFKEIENLGYNITCLGFIKSEITMNLIYSASNIFISPSIEESFGQTFLESIASGTPCIGFRNTGAEDIIIHKKNGYLAEYKNSNDINVGIGYILTNMKNMEYSVEKFSYKEISTQYIDLYKII